MHVIQRGNNRQTCFASDSDFKAYAHWLFEATSRFGVDVHAWVFMTNHVHLLMTPSSSQAISHTMQSLGRHYVRYFLTGLPALHRTQSGQRQHHLKRGPKPKTKPLPKQEFLL